MSLGRLNSLQAGRAIAAIAVVAFHLSSIISPQRSIIASLSTHGNAGVDFFFVLSGFIIFYAHQNDIGQSHRMVTYLKNRFVRVYPVYWMCTVAVVAVAFSGYGHGKLPSSLLGWTSTLTLIRLSGDPTPLNVAWTLFYEIAFYAIFATLILSRRLGVAALCGWALVILIANHSTPNNSVVGVWSSRICLNFFFGMAACWIHSRVNMRTAILMIFAGLVALVMAAVFVDRGLGESFGPVIALSFMFLVAGLSAVERVRDLNFGVLANIGNSSYMLYLAHVHIIAPLMKFMKYYRLDRNINSDIIFIMTMIFTLVLSYILYILLERPLISAFHYALRGVSRTPARLALESSIAIDAAPVQDRRTP